MVYLVDFERNIPHFIHIRNFSHRTNNVLGFVLKKMILAKSLFLKFVIVLKSSLTMGRLMKKMDINEKSLKLLPYSEQALAWFYSA